MEIVEKERSLPAFDRHSKLLFFQFFFSFSFFFLPTAEITARLMGKIGTNLPAAEGLMLTISYSLTKMRYIKFTYLLHTISNI